MLPDLLETIVHLLYGCIIYVISYLLRKWNTKLGYVSEITLALLFSSFIFYQNGYSDGFIYISFMSAGYLSMHLLLADYGKFGEIKAEINEQTAIEEIQIVRNNKRIFGDLAISILVFAGATLFLIYGPEYSLLNYVIVFGMLTAITEMIKRIITYNTTRIYLSKELESLYILSRLDSRIYPLEDIEKITIETGVDLLKLHPYLTLFTTNTDFTTSFDKVLRLQMPGETVYLTIKETETLKAEVEPESQIADAIEEKVTILPLYHKKNIKRLLGKFYFAITVKGVSAYTSILLLLYIIKAPVWLMVSFAIIYWLFNMYVSDRVLKVAMDAKPTKNPDVISAAEKIFVRAGIPNVNVYETDSAQYNGMATGMNIGKSMVTLTSATLTLPIEAIEGILAHEAVHVKKRDVMWGQLCRAFLMLVVVFSLLFVLEQIENIEDYSTPLFFIIWTLMLLFPLVQSFYLQLMEVRADHLGAAFLDGGKRQMADSLATLATRQDEALRKAQQYSLEIRNQKEIKSSLERSPWFYRLLEFQFMAHPPIYWRVHTLRSDRNQWGSRIWKRWLADRFKESFTK
ncbi:M56 family metallopeptidase [Oceanobacillus chungangensis]|uniref:Peptidase n=1 Tax=Oceanobacillus chungangensis TaxID=1229152 RepID=A0A3D8PIQ4_9BACI|nr:M48 family metalloprotease [Oceanobacillus chungangensis]RDW15065.1 peptidase [Oceanobacillus chungangensis]